MKQFFSAWSDILYLASYKRNFYVLSKTKDCHLLMRCVAKVMSKVGMETSFISGLSVCPSVPGQSVIHSSDGSGTAEPVIEMIGMKQS